MADATVNLPGLAVVDQPRPSIAKRKYRTTAEMAAYIRKIAADAGATMAEYRGLYKAVNFVCKNGYERPVKPATIKQNGWTCPCDDCTAEKDPKPTRTKCRSTAEVVEYLDQIAARAGAKMLDKDAYAGYKIAMIFECKNGYARPVTPNVLNINGWTCPCDDCNVKPACRIEVEFAGCAKKQRIRVDEVYKDSHTPIKCFCRLHNKVCRPRPGDVVDKGKRICSKCAHMDRLEAIRKKHSDIFDLQLAVDGTKRKGKYLTATQKVEAVCAEGHICWPIPASIAAGCNACGICAKPNSGENKFGEILRAVAAELGKEVRSQFIIPGQKKKWRYDYECDRIGFEFDGEQHQRAISVFGGEKGFKIQRQRDFDKTRLILKKGMRLVRVPYKWNRQPVEDKKAFIRACFASTDRLIVSDAGIYNWLTAENVGCAPVEQRVPNQYDADPVDLFDFADQSGNIKSDGCNDPADVDISLQPSNVDDSQPTAEKQTFMQPKRRQSTGVDDSERPVKRRNF